MPYDVKPEPNGKGGDADAMLLAAEGAGPEAGGEHEAKLSAADSAIAAAQAGDTAGFMASMEDFVRICMRKYGGGKA